MLQIAVDRLHDLFPNACIEVLTDSAENLARFCPAAKSLDNRGRAIWFANGVLPGRISDLAPDWVLNLLVRFKKTIRSRAPNVLEKILVRRLKRQSRQEDAEAVALFSGALQRADLLLICGAGGFYDGCRVWNLEILDLLEDAIQRKIPVAMLGQGFGPISDTVVLKRASKVLPKA